MAIGDEDVQVAVVVEVEEHAAPAVYCPQITAMFERLT